MGYGQDELDRMLVDSAPQYGINDNINLHADRLFMLCMMDGDNMMDAYIEYLMSNRFREIDYTVWVSRDGTITRLVDMSREHIDNTIRMLEHNRSDGIYNEITLPIVGNYIEALKSELQRRVQSIMVDKIQNVTLKVVGVTFQNENGTSRQSIISQMSKSTPVVLRREPGNQYDKNAIAVFAQIALGEHQIGYIGKEYAKIMADMMDRGRQFVARVHNVDKYKDNYYCEILINEV